MYRASLVLTLGLTAARAEALVLNSIAGVVRAVNTNEVTNVDQIWARLPLDMHAHPVIVTKSQSPNPASARRPRLLLVNDEGTLFAAATTAPKHPSFNRLELADADPISGEISLYLVDFKRRPVIERNPAECLRCHAVDGVVRLRVEAYPFWPGWLGHHDRAGEANNPRLLNDELRAMVAFAQGQPELPRLHQRYRDGFDLIEPVHQSATRLTVLAVRAEMRAAFTRLRRAPTFERMRLALAVTDRGTPMFTSLLTKEDRHAFEADEGPLRQELQLVADEHQRRINGMFGGSGWSEFFAFSEVRTLIPFEWAARRAGFSLASYATSIAPGAVNINTGLGRMDSYLRQFITDDLAEELNLGDEAPAKFAFLDLPFPRHRTHEFFEAARAKLCARGLSTAATPRSAPPASSP